MENSSGDEGGKEEGVRKYAGIPVRGDAAETGTSEVRSLPDIPTEPGHSLASAWLVSSCELHVASCTTGPKRISKRSHL